jgi:hypothetical protein
MAIYTLRDDNGDETTIEAASLKEARTAAKEWVEAGDWNDPEETFWVGVRIIDAEGDKLETVKIDVNPQEPYCLDDRGSHDWRSPYAIVGGIKENPGVWGHGGGVIISEVCVACGCGRTTDTWAQDRTDGGQGLTSVRYEPKKFAGEVTSAIDAEGE